MKCLFWKKSVIGMNSIVPKRIPAKYLAVGILCRVI